MSCGSFEPPPVKIELFGFSSATQSTAVAPVVSLVVEQSACNTW